MKLIARIAAGLVVAVIVLSAGGWLYLRTVMYKEPVFETTPPAIPTAFGADGRPAVVAFSKTNGFRHNSIPACIEAVEDLARKNEWTVFVTESGAVFAPEILERTNVVVSCSASGDNLTDEQESALREWIEGGGGFVGIHGAGGDPSYEWDWYVDTLIGAQFSGHTMNPQFPEATIVVEDRGHPATQHLPPTWTRAEEWYSFEESPRAQGVRVLATVDEGTYEPEMFYFFDLSMGDHPIIWSQCVGDGRSFYSALGHQPSAFAEPLHLKLLDGAIAWAAGIAGEDCGQIAAAH